MCVLFVQRHPAASGISQSPCATLWRQVCCVIGFLKLHLLNYEVHHCDLSFFVLGGNVQLGRYEAFHSRAETEEGREEDV